MGDLGPWGVVALRLLTSSVLLWAFFRPQIRSWTRQQWMTVIVMVSPLTGANAFFYVAIEQVPLAIAVAIEFMGPLVLATVMSRRKLDLVWIALSFTGMAILTAESQAKPEDFALMGVFSRSDRCFSCRLYSGDGEGGRAHSGHGRHGHG